MKVKIISFVLMLLITFSILPVPSAAQSFIMCSNYSEHNKISGNIYRCTACTEETYVCRICYPSHTHSTSMVCSTHNLYYTYCTYCGAYHCPDSSHGHPNYNYYCSIHKNVAYTYCSNCKSYYCTSCYGGYHNHSGAYCSIHKNVAKTYCSYCQQYYCTSCYGGYHNHSGTYCPTHKNTSYSYCSYCNAYYCSLCEGVNHSHSIGYTAPFYCTNHNPVKLSSYCSICGVYYCASCHGSYHNHTDYYGELRESYFVCKKHAYDIGAVQCSYCKYYYCPTCFGGYHNHGTSVPAVQVCDSPRASIANNSSVAYNTKITLSCDTENATIYYTTNGTVPTTNSTKYSGGITLTKNTTIRAIAVKSGYKNSSVSTFKYTVKSKVSFTDISDYPGLSSSLSYLIDAKVIADGTTFKPSASFTFGELETWLEAIDVSFDGVTGIDHFDEDDELSYNDFVYILYKALRKADLIKSPKSAGYTTLKSFTYSQDITNTSFYKAAFVSFYENDLLYDINFKPNDSATRVYLATAIAAVIVNNDL